MTETITREEAAIARMRSLIEQLERGEVLVKAIADSEEGLSVAVYPAPSAPPAVEPVTCPAGSETCTGTHAVPVAGTKICYGCSRPAV